MPTRPPLMASAVLNQPAAGVADAGPATTASLSREQILRATHACFAEHGYDGTTIRAIAARLGCSVGSIYRYFADKRALLLASAQSVFEPLLQQTQEAELGAAASMLAYVELAARYDDLYRLLFWLSAADGDTGVPRVVRDLIDAWAADLPDAEQRWATLHGLLMLNASPSQIATALEADPAATPAFSTPVSAPVPAPAGAAEDVTLL